MSVRVNICFPVPLYTSPPFRPLSSNSLPLSIMAPDIIEREQSISSDEKKDTKPHAAAYTLDTAAALAANGDITLTPEEGRRLRRKIDWHILPLMFGTLMFTFTTRWALLSLGISPLLGSVHG
jgi:hypothetical protein